jgi:hypothetical protein
METADLKPRVRWTVYPACALSASAGSISTIYTSTHEASGPHAKRVDGADDVDVSPQNKIGPGPDCVDGADDVDGSPRGQIDDVPTWGDGAMRGDDSPQDEIDDFGVPTAFTSDDSPDYEAEGE